MADNKKKFGEFVAKIRDVGVAKSSRFFIEMPPPPFFMQDADQSKTEMINLFCQSASLPGMMLRTMIVKDDGLDRQVVIDKSYGEMAFEFVADQDMVIKQYFDDWVSKAVATRGGTFAYSSEYTVDTITINQMNMAMDVVYSAILHDCYPVQVTDLPLNTESRGFHRVQVRFVYRWWESNSQGVNLSNVPDDVSTFLENQSNRNVPGVAQIRSMNANMKNGANMFKLSGEGVIGDNLAKDVDGQNFNFNF
jgi:hypothetical protein